MAHNSTMNNQQHSMMTSVAGSTQRGLTSSAKPMYPLQSSNMSQQHSHLQHQQQQQSQMMSGYSTQQQKPSDMSSRQYSPNMSSMNGGAAYQPLASPSIHSNNYNVDSGQLNIHHNQTTAHQYNQSQHQQHQSSLQQQPQQQHYHQSNAMSQHQQQFQNQKSMTEQQVLQSHQYNMHQGAHNQQQMASQHSHNQQQMAQHSHNQQIAPQQHSLSQQQLSSQHSHNQQISPQHSLSQQQISPQHSQNKPVHQPPQQQQSRQPYVHIQTHHRNVQQQEPKYDKIQTRHSFQFRANQRSHPRPVSKEPSSNQVQEPVVQPDVAPAQNSESNVIASKDDGNDKEEKTKEQTTVDQEIIDHSGSATENKELANTKEKTPMTLVQELAKFNKIERKYTLLDEQGPAHKKTFFVKLQLGTEEYQSSGASIRKAQQLAAAIALKETEFKHPPPKPVWKARKEPKIGEDGKLTPTVELNTLAMRRGEAATYKAIEPQQPPYYYPPGMDPRAMYSPRYYHYMRASRDPRYARGYWPMRYHYPRMNRAYYVSLHVGHREFIGDGATRQAARNNAAIKALKVLKNLPVDVFKVEEPEPVEKEEEDEADGTKSRVTSVHEIAFRRKMTVNFEVIRECGPAHMKNFITRCIVGDMVTEGDGKSKKIAKKIAAEQMYEKLKELPSLPPNAVKPKPKTQVVKKKNRIKSEIQQQKADPNYGVGVNPISRLIQIMCAQKKKEPVYTMLTERGVSCRKEFIMQIEVEGKTCNGSGPNKKLAKRAAAEAMLELLGYNKPSPQPAKSSIKQPSAEGNASNNGEKKVHFSESCQKALPNDVKASGTTGHQQKVPGLLHLPANTIVTTPVTLGSSINLPPTSASNTKESLVNLSNILKPNWRPELQLRELCKALNYPLEIDDFTKSQSNNTVECISRINIGPNDSQQNFLGSSSSVESARDMACMDALKVLVSRVKDMHPAGDGSPHIKKTVLSRNSSGMRDISPQ